jgi:hypothetical protein
MDKVIKDLSSGFKIVERSYEDDYYFWIVDGHRNDVKTFSSSTRARKWWELNMKDLTEKSESPARLKARKEVKKLVKRMGINFDKLTTKEQEEWIQQVI